MLTTNQMSNLKDAERDCNNMQTILNTAIDIQMLLRILVEKDIITRDEVAIYRDEVKSSNKYKNTQDYIDQTLREIKMFQKDPEFLLRSMMDRKMHDK